MKGKREGGREGGREGEVQAYPVACSGCFDFPYVHERAPSPAWREGGREGGREGAQRERK